MTRTSNVYRNLDQHYERSRLSQSSSGMRAKKALMQNQEDMKLPWFRRSRVSIVAQLLSRTQIVDCRYIVGPVVRHPVVDSAHD
jgi:hypothetical protein